jgi:hypothetical protein
MSVHTLRPFPGLPAAANVEQSIVFAQLVILRQLEAQRRQLVEP